MSETTQQPPAPHPKMDSSAVVPVQAPKPPTTTTACARRGGNYTVDEDLAVTRAYMNITMDPITGSDQKECTYYTRIWEVYKQKKPEDCVIRPMTSVQTRVKKILKETVRFAACHNSVVALRKSGHSDGDIIRLSTGMFNKMKVSHPREDVGKPFQFEKCWEILRDMPKFTAAGQGGATGSTSAESSTTDTGSSAVVKEKKERPDGRRKAKDELAAQHARAKKLKIAEQAVRLQQQQVEELSRRNEIILFTNGPGGSNSEMARQYFALKQAEVLERMRERMRSSEAQNATNLNLLGDVAENTDN